MAVYNLEKLFEPRAICVVTAGRENDTLGECITRNLTNGEYDGDVIRVIHGNQKFFGRSRGLRAVSDAKKPVDLVIAAIPANEILAVVQQSVEIGAGAVIIASGLSKSAKINGTRLGEITQIVETSGIRVIGPNSNGIISCRIGLNASLMADMPLPGKIALISQSGAIGASILDLSLKKQMGFSFYVGLGGMLDVEFGDLIDYLGADSHVSSIVMYAENLVRFRNFMSAARKLSRVKPIIALKAGRTPGGAMAAAAHTGEGAGNDTVYDEAFSRAGIIRVKTFEELFDCAELVAKQQRPSGTGLVIITNAGGPGVMAADALSDYGASPMPLPPDLVQKLDDLLPAEWSRNNPIDIQGDADPQRYCRVVDLCRNYPEIHAYLIIYAPQGATDSEHIAEALIKLLREKPHLLFVSFMGGDRVEKSCQILNKAGIPTFDTPERAVRAFMDLYKYANNLKTLQEIPAKLPRKLTFERETAQTIIQNALVRGDKWFGPHEAEALLDAYGIRVTQELDAAFFEKYASIDVNEPRSPAGVAAPSPGDGTEEAHVSPAKQHISLCIGVMTDPCFGPVIIFGPGNGMPASFDALAVSLPPLNRLLARRLMEKSHMLPLLESHRHFTVAHVTFLEEILTRISQLVSDFAEIDTLILNPFCLDHHHAHAMDIRIHVSPPCVRAPMHLVISAYPNQYESEVLLENVGTIRVRPIKPEDAPLLSDLFDSLSPQTIYFRFFTPLKSLPRHMLARFTQIDYDREIALVAIQESHNAEKMLAVSRVILAKDQKSAEFAILVSDSWQGKGIGAELLKRCLSISTERNIREVYGIVLAENTTMLALGRKLGFDMKSISGGSEYELRIKLVGDA